MKRKGYDVGAPAGEAGLPLNELDKTKDVIEGGEKIELKRSVTLLNGVAIIVGSIIGSGIFLTPSGVYEQAQNPYMAISVWALCGVFSLIGALCFAELGTCITRSGGDFAYILEAFGQLPGFITLFVTILVIRPTTAAIVALTFANYALKPFYEDCTPPYIPVQLLAAGCLTLLTAINCISIRVTMKIQDVFTAAKLIALVAIIVTGFVYILGVGFSPMALSISFYNGLFAYAGWNYLNMVTAELKDPYRNLPRAIWIGLPLVTVIYVLANLAYYIVLTPNQLLTAQAVAVDFGSKTFFKNVPWLIPIFVALSTFGGVNGTLFTSARLFFVGAQEGQLPKFLAFVHTNKFTPVPALVLQCIVSVGILFTGSMFQLINCVSFVLWVSTGVSVAALIRLRYTQPDLPRPIRINLFFPYLYIIFTCILVLFGVISQPYPSGAGLLITACGIPIYLIFVKGKLIDKNENVRRKFGDFSHMIQKVFTVVPQETGAQL